MTATLTRPDIEGFTNVEEVEVMPENVRFGLPPEIVKAIASAPVAAN